MADKPILFSAPMVRALLAGTKTQTRRAVTWQGPKGYPRSFEHALVDNPAGVQRLLVPFNHPGDADEPWGENGYHRHYSVADPGDRFWVKEALKLEQASSGIVYKAFAADSQAVPFVAEGWQWKVRHLPSMYMPKWASRLTLHVTQVRVQRLHEIDEADAIAEGIERLRSGRGFYDPRHDHGAVHLHYFERARDAYSALWDHINGDDAWDRNPWVFAYTFAVEKCHIDQAARAAA